MRILVFLLVILFPVFLCGQNSHNQMPIAAKDPAADAALGNVNHPVATKSAGAKKYFNQGLAYIYAFNHEEAVRSFKHAADLDPNLAMAFWGVALARGSNYNVTADAGQLKEAWANLEKAMSLAPNASDADRAYINALSRRYSSDPLADPQKLAANYRTA